MGGSTNSELTALLTATDGTWSAAVATSQTAASLELATGTAVMSTGGWGGSDSAVTLEQFQAYVASGQISYYIGGGQGGGPGGDSDSTSSQIAEWVAANYTADDGGRPDGVRPAGLIGPMPKRAKVASGASDAPKATFASFRMRMGKVKEPAPCLLDRGTPNGVWTRIFAGGAMSCRPECGRGRPIRTGTDTGGATMSRMTIDCRAVPSESGCSLTLSGEEDEVLRAATAHAIDVHGHADGEELRAGLRAALVPEVAGPQRRRGRVRAGDRVPHNPAARVPGSRGPLAGRDRS